jgi:hypothetical protein
MLRALCLGLVVLPPLDSSRGGTLDAPESNAALKYWQAFSTLPRFTDAEQTKIHDYLTASLDDDARKIVSQADYSLRMLHQGAALRHCDWGVSPEEGIYVRFTQAPASRVLANLACLRARMRFAEGKRDEAIEDVVDTLTMSRHIPLCGTNIMLLVGYAIESVAIDALAHDLPKLDAGSIRSLRSRLETLPPGMDAAAALKSEEVFYLVWFIRIVKQAKDKDQLVSLLDFVNLEAEGKPSGSNKARQFVEECGSVANVLRFAEETRGSYDATSKLLELPLDRFEREFEAESAKRASNPVFKFFFPAMLNVRRAEARMNIRRSLLKAALAVQLEGRAALKNYLDPVVGGPFEYVATPAGYELRSQYKGNAAKLVVLQVGRQNRP